MSSRGRIAVPYARRGISMQQLKDMNAGLVESGWLREQCDDYNSRMKDDKGYMMDLNLYSFNQFFVKPVTTPISSAPPLVPEKVRRLACIPDASHGTSYSELVNVAGVVVDYFVSHFWGHYWPDTFEALNKWAMRKCIQLGHHNPAEVTYWICLFALNQHSPDEEVGSSPEEGPFYAALNEARAGAVMVVDEGASPFSRIWCLYEVHCLSKLPRFKERFQMICSRGPVAKLVEESKSVDEQSRNYTYVHDLGTQLQRMAASTASASVEKDKHAIWHRIASPWIRKRPLEKVLKCGWFNSKAFYDFDTQVRSLLADSLFHASLINSDIDGALKYIGLAATCNQDDIDQMVQLNCDVMSASTTIETGNGYSRCQCSLMNCLAHFAHDGAFMILVQMKADLNARDPSQGASLLHWAARGGSTAIVEALLERGVDVDSQLDDGTTPLHWATWANHPMVLHLLMDHRACPDTRRNDLRHTSLHIASYDGIEEAAEKLLDFKANPNIQGADGRTPVHAAAIEGHVCVLQYLLFARARIDVQDGNGNTPLFWAASQGNFDVATVLVESRADVDPRMDGNGSPLLVSVYEGYENLTRLLLDHHANPSGLEMDKIRPLHSAASQGHLELVRLLLDRRALPNLRTSSWTTALDYATEGGHADIADLLTRSGGQRSLVGQLVRRKALYSMRCLIRRRFRARKQKIASGFARWVCSTQRPTLHPCCPAGSPESG